MAVTYGFYNSVNSDRKYNSIQISSLFDGLIEDGVYLSVGDAFAVTQNTVPDLHVQVGEGRAWFNHTWTLNDAHILLTIETPDILYPRIDVVVLEVNSSDAVRANTIKIIKGTPAASPVPPTLVHTADVNQYPLAEIAVAANDTEIINANITIKVGTVYCPYVAGVLSSFDVETLLAQWDSYFDNTFLPGLDSQFDNTWLPARLTEFNNWLSSRLSDYNSWIAARDVEFDAWLAGLDDPMLAHQRKGGSSTNWNEPGSTTYELAGAKVSFGSIETVIQQGNRDAFETITFPSNFAVGTVPMIFLSVQLYNPEGYVTVIGAAYLASSNSGFTLYVYRDTTTPAQFVYVSWMAIGQA